MVIISALFDGGSCCDAITCPMMQRVSLSLPLFLLGVIFTTSQRMAARFMTSIPSAGGSNTFQIRILREEDFEPFRGRLMPLPADCQPARRRIINSEMWLPVLPVLFHFVWIYMHTHTHTHIYMGLFRLKYRNQLFARVRKFVKCCGFICDMTLESVPVWVLSNGSKTVPVHPSLLTPSHPIPPYPALPYDLFLDAIISLLVRLCRVKARGRGKRGRDDSYWLKSSIRKISAFHGESI